MLFLAQKPSPKLSTRNAPFNLPKAALDSRDWLFEHALPLWSTKGFDTKNGIWMESLKAKGNPSEENRRARVQGRQTFVFALAGNMGWQGPWVNKVESGFLGINKCFAGEKGLLNTLVSPDGEILKHTSLLYDQTFVILALATARHQTKDPAAKATTLLDAIEEQFRNTNGRGFIENCITHPYQSNAHMHLLEAAMAWVFANHEDEINEPRWTDLANEIVELAKDHFIDREQGFLREFFNPDWSPKDGMDGTIVEPGHQFEWAWLLARWARYTSCEDTMMCARKLFEAGTNGISAVSGAAVNTLNDNLEPVTQEARLWPQTEWLKAALVLYECAEVHERTYYLGHIENAYSAMNRYLNTKMPGLWFDKLHTDNTFEAGLSPASSLYHIICAVDQLVKTADVATTGEPLIQSPVKLVQTDVKKPLALTGA